MKSDKTNVHQVPAQSNDMSSAVDRFGPKLPPINLLNMVEWYYVLEYRKHRELGNEINRDR